MPQAAERAEIKKAQLDSSSSSHQEESCREFTKNLSIKQFLKLPPEEIARLNLNDLRPTFIKALSPKIMQHVTIEQLAVFLPEKVAQLISPQFMSMSLAQFAALDLSLVSPYIIKKLGPEYVAHAKSLTLEQKQMLEYSQLIALPPDKFRKFNLILVFPYEYFSKLPEIFFDTVTINQLDKIDEFARLRVLSHFINDKRVKKHLAKKIDKLRRDQWEAIEREIDTSYQSERR